MRLDKLTLKSQEALQSSQQLADQYGHQQIETERLIQDPLALKILEGSVKEHDHVWVDVCDGEIIFNKLSTVEHAAAVS
jgi:ATP-dependent Clp protease ATP-binding subunit ClpA